MGPSRRVELRELTSLRRCVELAREPTVSKPHLRPRQARHGGQAVDTPLGAHYSRIGAMSVRKVQIGQLWKKDGTSDIYLVTRVYDEALSTVAVLRKSGAEQEALIRVRIGRNAQGQTLPGFSPAMQDERL